MSILILLVASMAYLGLSRTVRQFGMNTIDRPLLLTQHPWLDAVCRILLLASFAQAGFHGYLIWPWKGILLYPIATFIFMMPFAFLTARFTDRFILFNPVVCGFGASAILASITIVRLTKSIIS
ncbi:MAG: hypothetical protein HOG49_19030 [Candidatus Scalindua sp.]|jgi:hypothetical protein|nr:hypothetical protein [Candidatus Scalindua sp.]